MGRAAFPALLAALLSVMALLATARQNQIQIQEETLSIAGVSHAYDLMLIADTHISLCDNRDPSLLEKAARRRESFMRESGRNTEKIFERLISETQEMQPDLTVFAGDIIDSAMYASVDFVKGQFARLQTPYLYIAGNHDFEYGEEYFSGKAYREYFPRLAELTGTDRQYCVKEFDDLLVIGVNDKNNQLPKSAVEDLLPLLRGTKPVILALHVPLQPQDENSRLEMQANEIWGLSAKGRCRVLIGETACRPNRTTQKFLDAVFAEDSPVAAVLAGHIHFYNRSMVSDTLLQEVTGAGYKGEAVRLHIKPLSDRTNP